MKKIISVAGARPNFIKIAPLCRQLATRQGFEHLLCHTGQHFDRHMSKIFFEELEIPAPDFNLGVGSGTHAQQTAGVMLAFEEVLLKEKPDCVIVVGDVNSTIACALTAAKLHIPVAHVEAGLRSFDRQMPEEINRVLTDSISDFLFVTEQSGLDNLQSEGVSEKKVFFTGNIMIDSLIYFLPKIDKSGILAQKKLQSKQYSLCTFHRPRNVDTPGALENLVDFLNQIAEKEQVVFPAHPRTSKNLKKFGLQAKLSPGILLSAPLGYLDFLALTKHARMVITDSGGIQEETTFLGVPCVTVRNNTERPATVRLGTNYLEGTDFDKVKQRALDILAGNKKTGTIPPLWDGKVAQRIADTLNNNL